MIHLKWFKIFIFEYRVHLCSLVWAWNLQFSYLSFCSVGLGGYRLVVEHLTCGCPGFVPQPHTCTKWKQTKMMTLSCPHCLFVCLRQGLAVLTKLALKLRSSSSAPWVPGPRCVLPHTALHYRHFWMNISRSLSLNVHDLIIFILHYPLTYSLLTGMPLVFFHNSSPKVALLTIRSP